MSYTRADRKSTYLLGAHTPLHVSRALSKIVVLGVATRGLWAGRRIEEEMTAMRLPWEVQIGLACIRSSSPSINCKASWCRTSIPLCSSSTAQASNETNNQKVRNVHVTNQRMRLCSIFAQFIYTVHYYRTRISFRLETSFSHDFPTGIASPRLEGGVGWGGVL